MFNYILIFLVQNPLTFLHISIHLDTCAAHDINEFIPDRGSIEIVQKSDLLRELIGIPCFVEAELDPAVTLHNFTLIGGYNLITERLGDTSTMWIVNIEESFFWNYLVRLYLLVQLHLRLTDLHAGLPVNTILTHQPVLCLIGTERRFPTGHKQLLDGILRLIRQV